MIVPSALLFYGQEDIKSNNKTFNNKIGFKLIEVTLQNGQVHKYCNDKDKHYDYNYTGDFFVITKNNKVFVAYAVEYICKIILGGGMAE